MKKLSLSPKHTPSLVHTYQIGQTLDGPLLVTHTLKPTFRTTLAAKLKGGKR